MSLYQLLLSNGIELDNKLINIDSSRDLFCVSDLLELLKIRGTEDSVKSKIIEYYGNKFEDSNEVLAYLTGVAFRILNDKR